MTFTYDDGLRPYDTKKPFEGVIPNLERRWKETEILVDARGDRALYHRRALRGLPRLPAEARGAGGQDRRPAYRRGHRAFDPQRRGTGSKTCRRGSTTSRTRSPTRILKEIRERLHFLVDVGLDYLTLSRNSGTLSGGEGQRIRLASQIGSGLTGVLYVLDEPSIGLHQRDNDRLLATLRHLRDLGNTVIVVEHDEDAIRTADYVVDIGPAAGVHGGEVVAEGTPAEIMANPKSLTGQYLTGALAIAMPEKRREADQGAVAEDHRRDGQQPQIDLGDDPARRVHRVTGVSGGGKSTLPDRHALQGGGAAAQRRARAPGALRATRRPRASRQGHRHRPVADRPHAALQSGDLYRRLHADPRLVRRPAGGQGARLQAGPLLVQRQGRALRGLPGRRRHQDRDALPAGRLCHLRRLQGRALQSRDAGGEVQGQVDRRRARHDRRRGARASSPPCRRSATRWRRCSGSGSATSRSASRRRRCRAARRSASSWPRNCRGGRPAARSTSSTSRPPACISTTSPSCSKCCTSWSTGNTVVVIEHNLEVIKTADWIIDLGPEGGDGGGEIVAAGTPEEIAEVEGELYRAVPQAGAGAPPDRGGRVDGLAASPYRITPGVPFPPR